MNCCEDVNSKPSIRRTKLTVFTNVEMYVRKVVVQRVIQAKP
jgi:hypothetical protein